MRRRSILSALVVMSVAVAVSWSCARTGGRAGGEADKIPVTCASEEARQAFLTGRQHQENLRATDARQDFLRAVELDGNFAWAHLGVAQTAQSASDFFAALAHAVEHAGHASEGERLLIQSFAAGVNADPGRQLTLLQALVAAYPNDERAHNQLGLYHFGRQEWDQAVLHLRKATEINPSFAPAYNQLGYALRFMGDYAGAEEAFQAYIELIPDEPNPYDSYAELLMKTGRFTESIAQYEKALALNPQFIASYIGIGNNLMFMGAFDEAREQFDRLTEVARTDGERRLARTWRAFSFLHQGDHESALEEVRGQFAIAEAAQDLVGMSGDLNLMGDILLDAGRADEAVANYRESVDMAERSNATDQAKEAARRNHVADLTRVALATDDIDGAAATAEEYRRQVEQHGVAFEIWQSHELFGLIALARGDFEAALDELSLANQQDARVMLAQVEALEGMGEKTAALEMLERAANFNTLNQAPQNYAMVRPRALALLEE